MSSCMLRLRCSSALPPLLRSYILASTKKIATGITSATTAAASTSSTPQTLEGYSPSYKSLLDKLRTITYLNQASLVLEYDRQVFLPSSPRASAQRGKQMAVLACIAHEKSIDPEIGTLIDKSMKDLNELTKSCTSENDSISDDLITAKRILNLEKVNFEQRTRIPADLAARRAELTTTANAAWVKSRQDNHYASFAPYLKQCFELAAETATLVPGRENDIPIYSRMLESFVGMPADRVDTIFDEVQSALVPFIGKIRRSGYAPSLAPLSGKFNVDAQKEAARKIVTTLGYDEEHGRIDVSDQPFTVSLSRDDVRITSNFNDEWYQGLMSTIHEAGHAMYDQNLIDSDLSLDMPLSVGVHESQAYFWERHVGKSKAFYKWATPILKEVFEKDGEDKFDYTPDELYAAVNAVQFNPACARPDELTFALHMILCYNIERDVVGGKLSIYDIPARWNAETKQFFNIDVTNNYTLLRSAYHWSFLYIGYFPAYLIGDIMAAQLVHYCKQDLPDFDLMIERGEFDEINKWLTAKVHVHGSRYSSIDEMLHAQVGEPLNPKYFIDNLKQKYTELYKLNESGYVKLYREVGSTQFIPLAAFALICFSTFFN